VSGPNWSAEEIRALAMQRAAEGDAEAAAEQFERLSVLEPEQGDGWINLATAERAQGKLAQAADHYRRGIALLEALQAPDQGLLATALHALGATLEGLEETDAAVEAYSRSAQVDPRAPTPFAALSGLLARAGHLREADQVATKYCLAAVSVLAEKSNIGAVRQFQKALKDAAAVDGNLVLIATREAYAQSFAATAAKLPRGARLEVEPHRRDEAGRAVPLLPNPNRPASRVRFDALKPETGERWMIQDVPTYGFPPGCPAAADGHFSIPHPAARTPFPVFLSTRTAWDYFFVRMRLRRGLSPEAIARAERHLGAWYLRGFEGGFSEGGRGFFHFLSEPTPVGPDGLRYEVDLGLAQLDAIPALFDALTALHAEEPLAVVMLGDGALPLIRSRACPAEPVRGVR
jgi:tetratricopeptide (TPR) repeat protein